MGGKRGKHQKRKNQNDAGDSGPADLQGSPPSDCVTLVYITKALHEEVGVMYAQDHKSYDLRAVLNLQPPLTLRKARGSNKKIKERMIAAYIQLARNLQAVVASHTACVDNFPFRVLVSAKHVLVAFEAGTAANLPSECWVQVLRVLRLGPFYVSGHNPFVESSGETLEEQKGERKQQVQTTAYVPATRKAFNRECAVVEECAVDVSPRWIKTMGSARGLKISSQELTLEEHGAWESLPIARAITFGSLNTPFVTSSKNAPAPSHATDTNDSSQPSNEPKRRGKRTAVVDSSLADMLVALCIQQLRDADAALPEHTSGLPRLYNVIVRISSWLRSELRIGQIIAALKEQTLQDGWTFARSGTPERPVHSLVISGSNYCVQAFVTADSKRYEVKSHSRWMICTGTINQTKEKNDTEKRAVVNRLMKLYACTHTTTTTAPDKYALTVGSKELVKLNLAYHERCSQCQAPTRRSLENLVQKYYDIGDSMAAHFGREGFVCTIGEAYLKGTNRKRIVQQLMRLVQDKLGRRCVEVKRLQFAILVVPNYNPDVVHKLATKHPFYRQPVGLLPPDDLRSQNVYNAHRLRMEKLERQFGRKQSGDEAGGEIDGSTETSAEDTSESKTNTTVPQTTNLTPPEGMPAEYYQELMMLHIFDIISCVPGFRMFTRCLIVPCMQDAPTGFVSRLAALQVRRRFPNGYGLYRKRGGGEQGTTDAPARKEYRGVPADIRSEHWSMRRLQRGIESSLEHEFAKEVRTTGLSCRLLRAAKAYDAWLCARVINNLGLLSHEAPTFASDGQIQVSGRHQETVVVMLSGGMDSPVAAFLMMTRGVRVVLVHFQNVNAMDENAVQNKILLLARQLAKFQPHTSLYVVPFAQIQKELISYVQPGMRMLVYRRIMMRIASIIGKKYNASFLVTGDSVGQVASQTLSNLRATYSFHPDILPKLPPLIAMKKDDIIAIGKVTGTYPISALPYGDCCSYFMPKHPVTKIPLGVLEKLEGCVPIGMLRCAVHCAMKVHINTQGTVTHEDSMKDTDNYVLIREGTKYITRAMYERDLRCGDIIPEDTKPTPMVFATDSTTAGSSSVGSGADDMDVGADSAGDKAISSGGAAPAKTYQLPNGQECDDQKCWLMAPSDPSKVIPVDLRLSTESTLKKRAASSQLARDSVKRIAGPVGTVHGSTLKTLTIRPAIPGDAISPVEMFDQMVQPALWNVQRTFMYASDRTVQGQFPRSLLALLPRKPSVSYLPTANLLRAPTLQDSLLKRVVGESQPDQIAYLDHGASTPMCAQAALVSAITSLSSYTYAHANPNSLHAGGQNGARLVNEARRVVHQTLDIPRTSPKDLIFTAGGTEANNLAIRGYIWGLLRGDLTRQASTKRPLRKHRPSDSPYTFRPHIITTRKEHSAVLNVCRALARPLSQGGAGALVSYADIDQDGVVNLAHLEQLVHIPADQVPQDFTPLCPGNATGVGGGALGKSSSDGWLGMHNLQRDVTKSVPVKTVLVSLIHVNNEIGTIQDMPAIAHLLHRRFPGVVLHTDACQSFAKIPFTHSPAFIQAQTVKTESQTESKIDGTGSVRGEWDDSVPFAGETHTYPDLITLNAHKIHGPKGVGALYIRDGLRVDPIMQGGGHERGLRSGTLNVPGITAFAAACLGSTQVFRDDVAGSDTGASSAGTKDPDATEHQKDSGSDTKLQAVSSDNTDGTVDTVANTTQIHRYVKSLRRRLYEGCCHILRDHRHGVILNGPPLDSPHRLWNNLSVVLGRLSGEQLVYFLSKRGVFVSTGSACASNDEEAKASHVLTAIGRTYKEALSTIRFTFSVHSSRREIDQCLVALQEFVDLLQNDGK